MTSYLNYSGTSASLHCSLYLLYQNISKAFQHLFL